MVAVMWSQGRRRVLISGEIDFELAMVSRPSALAEKCGSLDESPEFLGV